MKIVYCIHSLDNLRGMERVLLDKANYWIEKFSFEIIIIVKSSQFPDSSFYLINPKIKFVFLNIDSVQIKSITTLFKHLRQQTYQKKEIAKVLFQEKADIVISMFGNEKRFLTSIKDGSKKILEIHTSRNYLHHLVESYKNNFLIYFMKKIVQQKEEYIINKFDRFVVLTNEDKENWKHIKRIETIGNSIKKNRFKKGQLVNRRVISVGALSNEKGFDRLIKAWEYIYQTHPDWTLTIVGGGVESVALQKQISDLRLENHIKMLPPTTQIEKEYLDSSIYVSTSRFEGFPMVLLEASSYGLPCISFACKCGPSEIIKDKESGFLVPDGNIKMLAEKINLLIDDENLRAEMGKKAIIESERYSQEKIMNKWNNLFINTLSE